MAPHHQLKHEYAAPSEHRTYAIIPTIHEGLMFVQSDTRTAVDYRTTAVLLQQYGRYRCAHDGWLLFSHHPCIQRSVSLKVEAVHLYLPNTEDPYIRVVLVVTSKPKDVHNLNTKY